MRAVTSIGGIVGRGYSENVLQKWILGAPTSALIVQALEKFVGTNVQFSEQHAELGPTRLKIDSADKQRIVEWFKIHNPFINRSADLVSLSSGMTTQTLTAMQRTDEDCLSLPVRPRRCT